MANQATHKDTTFKVGDIVKVYQRVQEDKDKARTQMFEGIVIAIKAHNDTTFTVRKIATGEIGVEKIFPLNATTIIRVEVKKPGNVRRAKLYYLRDRIGKGAIKVKGKRVVKQAK